jgi:CheY-like chemotaxis protein
VTIIVSLLLQSTTPQLRIVVEDYGIGISEKSRELAFFTSDQTERQTGGSGFGLFCLSKRVEALNGSCGVCSRCDDFSGTEFWLEIPYRPTTDRTFVQNPKESMKIFTKNSILKDSNQEEETSPRTISANVDKNNGHSKEHLSKDKAITTNNNSMKILLVENMVSIAKMCSMVLRKDGHIVHHSLNGADALSKCHLYSPFDAVIMDIQMPVMDGLEATRKIREMEKVTGERQLIIGCSANSDYLTIREALAAGVDSFMSKPFTLATFYQKYNNHREPILSYDI